MEIANSNWGAVACSALLDLRQDYDFHHIHFLVLGERANARREVWRPVGERNTIQIMVEPPYCLHPLTYDDLFQLLKDDVTVYWGETEVFNAPPGRIPREAAEYVLSQKARHCAQKEGAPLLRLSDLVRNNPFDSERTAVFLTMRPFAVAQNNRQLFGQLAREQYHRLAQEGYDTFLCVANSPYGLLASMELLQVYHEYKPFRLVYLPVADENQGHVIWNREIADGLRRVKALFAGPGLDLDMLAGASRATLTYRGILDLPREDVTTYATERGLLFAVPGVLPWEVLSAYY